MQELLPISWIENKCRGTNFSENQATIVLSSPSIVLENHTNDSIFVKFRRIKMLNCKTFNFLKTTNLLL